MCRGHYCQRAEQGTCPESEGLSAPTDTSFDSKMCRNVWRHVHDRHFGLAMFVSLARQPARRAISKLPMNRKVVPSGSSEHFRLNVSSGVITCEIVEITYFPK
jgi:hypothetical protein